MAQCKKELLSKEDCSCGCGPVQGSEGGEKNSKERKGTVVSVKSDHRKVMLRAAKQGLAGNSRIGTQGNVRSMGGEP